MKKIKLFIATAVVATIFSSCAVTVPYAVSNAQIGSKRGVSSSFCLGAIQVNPNLSVADAAKNGSIKGGVATVDIKTTTFIPYLLYVKEIVVTGN